MFQDWINKKNDREQKWAMRVIPVGEIFNRTKVSCSGSFLRISAATGSGWTPCRSPDTLCERIILAATGICSPFTLWSGKFWKMIPTSGIIHKPTQFRMFCTRYEEEKSNLCFEHTQKSKQFSMFTTVSNTVKGRQDMNISKCFIYVTLLTASPLVWRYVVSSFEASAILSSSSEPSTLSNALTLATGDLGEVGRTRWPARGVTLTWPDLPGIKKVGSDNLSTWEDQITTKKKKKDASFAIYNHITWHEQWHRCEINKLSKVYKLLKVPI